MIGDSRRTILKGQSVLVSLDTRDIADDSSVCQLNDTVGIRIGVSCIVRNDQDQLILGQFLKKIQDLV